MAARDEVNLGVGESGSIDGESPPEVHAEVEPEAPKPPVEGVLQNLNPWEQAN